MLWQHIGKGLRFCGLSLCVLLMRKTVINLKQNDFLRWLRHGLFGRRRKGQLLFLEYKIKPEPRYGQGKPPHPVLADLFNRQREQYHALLHQIVPYIEQFTTQFVQAEDLDVFSRYFTGLDALMLYSLIRLKKPQRYIEIGSGSSTRIARMAIQDENLTTQVVSIDPMPRRDVAQVADRVIDQYLEDVDLTLFDAVEANDIVFLDGSHRVFTNSDVTIVFMDILPSLKPGVLMHIHDIFLPDDYPITWIDRYYSEQYLLACYLLAKNQLFDIVHPGYYVASDPHLSSIVVPKFPPEDVMPRDSVSFWIQTK